MTPLSSRRPARSHRVSNRFGTADLGGLVGWQARRSTPSARVVQVWEQRPTRALYALAGDLVAAAPTMSDDFRTAFERLRFDRRS